MGFLEVEVFAPEAHTVAPVDPNNVTWESPLLPALPFGPLNQGDMFANAFILLIGFVTMVGAIFLAKKLSAMANTKGGIRSAF